MHRIKLSKDDKDGAFIGKVKCTNAKWEIDDKVSGLWERQDLCRAVAEKCKSLSLNVLIRARSHLGRQLLGAGCSHSTPGRTWGNWSLDREQGL